MHCFSICPECDLGAYNLLLELDFLVFIDTPFLCFFLYIRFLLPRCYNTTSQRSVLDHPCTYLRPSHIKEEFEIRAAVCALSKKKSRKKDGRLGPVVIAVVLFVLLSPGSLFQFPGRRRVVEFGNMQTSGIAILVHTIIFFGLITIFLVVIGVNIYTG